MAEQEINLIKLTDPSIPLLEDVADSTLFYIVLNGISYKTQWGYLRRLIESDSGSSLPEGNEGDGIIYENGDWIARRLTADDIDDLKIKMNVSVTTSSNGTQVTVNPNSILQSYIINNQVYELTNSISLPITALSSDNNSRIDVIVVRPNGVADLIQGQEATIALEPAIGENDLRVGSILVQGPGLSIDILETFFDNGLERVSNKIGLGGDLVRNTTLNTNGFDLEILDSSTNSITIRSGSDLELSSGNNESLNIDSSSGLTVNTQSNSGIKYTSSITWNNSVDETLVSKEAVAFIVEAGSEGDVVYRGSNNFEPTDFMNLDPTNGVFTTSVVNNIPLVGQADKVIWYNDDYEGISDSASPYAITEDGVTLSLRQATEKNLEFEVFPSLNTTRILSFKGGDALVRIEADLVNIFQSFEYKVRKNSSPNTSFEDATSFNEVVDWVLGSSSIGSYTPPANGENVQVQILCNFQSSWSEIADFKIVYLPL